MFAPAGEVHADDRRMATSTRRRGASPRSGGGSDCIHGSVSVEVILHRSNQIAVRIVVIARPGAPRRRSVAVDELDRRRDHIAAPVIGVSASLDFIRNALDLVMDLGYRKDDVTARTESVARLYDDVGASVSV